MHFFTDIIAQTISTAHPEISAETVISNLEKPRNAEFGDLALPCFKYAGVFQKPPMKIAEGLIALFANNPAFESLTNVNGYLNFKFKRSKFVENLIEDLKTGKFTQELEADGAGKTMVIDFSSPNIAKKLHLGTFRSTIIGNAIYKIYKTLGWKVVRINHLGDWGTQFGKLMSAYLKWGNEEELHQRPMAYLVELYVRFNTEAENNPDLDIEGRAWFAKLENKDPEAVKMWEIFRKYTLEDLHKSYNRIGVEFDYYWGEAFYEPFLGALINEIENSIGKISEGALIVDLEEYNMPPCLIRKSDGASTYAARDIAAAKYRYEQFKYDQSLYVIGATQQLHCNQFFKSMELLGYDFAKNCKLIGFGKILGLSTRKGTAVYLDELFDEAQERALKIIDERNPELPDKEITADKIGIGAIIFQDLAKSRIKDSEFNWERVLSFEGETGPYVQYAYMRIFNILEKIGELDTTDINAELLTDDVSYTLLIILNEFSDKIRKAQRDCEPFVIADYILDLAKAFNKFYHANRVNGEEENVVKARVWLLKELAKTYAHCMEILGVPVITKM